MFGNFAATLNWQHPHTDLAQLAQMSAKSYSAKLCTIFIGKNAIKAILYEQRKMF
jgi:hypothetical protein